MTAPTPPEGVTSLAEVSRNGRSQPPHGSSSSIVMLSDPRSAAAEAYRSLAASLQFSSLDRPVQTIGITSAAPGEGKSSTVANLAVALAEGGRRVIVIDADLRRPGLHALFGVDPADGLTSVLLGERAQLPLVDTPAVGVRLLASGPSPANPLEALASERFEQVLAMARAQADFVLVDTTPAGALADATVLARRVDGMLLVVKAGSTRRDLAIRARDQLERVNANILGVVLVDVTGDDALYRY
jgi:capsular exopolysaccharide synthesis family protein